MSFSSFFCSIFFFFNDTATTEIYTLSLHDALPISTVARPFARNTRSLVEQFAAASSPRSRRRENVRAANALPVFRSIHPLERRKKILADKSPKLPVQTENRLPLAPTFLYRCRRCGDIWRNLRSVQTVLDSRKWRQSLSNIPASPVRSVPNARDAVRPSSGPVR